MQFGYIKNFHYQGRETGEEVMIFQADYLGKIVRGKILPS